MKSGTWLALRRYGLITLCCVPAAGFWGAVAAGRMDQALGVAVGVGHAVVLSPLVATMLWRKRLVVAIPVLLLGTSLVVVGVNAVLPVPPLLFGIATVAYLLLGCILAVALPNLVRDRARRGRCYWCGYHLRGLVGDTCPECGRLHTPRDADGNRLSDFHIQRE